MAQDAGSWTDVWLGREWLAGEYDCGHFAADVLASQFGRAVPSAQARLGRARRDAVLSALARDSAGCRLAAGDTPQDGDVALLARARAVELHGWHVGVLVDSAAPSAALLHLDELGSRLTPIGRLEAEGMRLHAWYRMPPARGPAEPPAVMPPPAIARVPAPDTSRALCRAETLVLVRLAAAPDATGAGPVAVVLVPGSSPTLADLLDAVWPGVGKLPAADLAERLEIRLRGALLEGADWPSTTLAAGDAVEIASPVRNRRVLQGLFAVAAIVASFALPALGWAWYYTAATVAAISVGGALLTDALFPLEGYLPAPEGGASQGAAVEPSHSLSGGSNRARPWEPMMLVLGRHLAYPAVIASPWRSYDRWGAVGFDRRQHYHGVYSWGIGDLQIDDVKVGNLLLADLPIRHTWFKPTVGHAPGSPGAPGVPIMPPPLNVAPKTVDTSAVTKLSDRLNIVALGHQWPSTWFPPDTYRVGPVRWAYFPAEDKVRFWFDNVAMLPALASSLALKISKGSVTASTVGFVAERWRPGPGLSEETAYTASQNLDAFYAALVTGSSVSLLIDPSNTNNLVNGVTGTGGVSGLSGARAAAEPPQLTGVSPNDRYIIAGQTTDDYFCTFEYDDNSGFTSPQKVYDTFESTIHTADWSPPQGTTYVRGRLTTAANDGGTKGAWSAAVTYTTASAPAPGIPNPGAVAASASALWLVNDTSTDYYCTFEYDDNSAFSSPQRLYDTHSSKIHIVDWTPPGGTTYVRARLTLGLYDGGSRGAWSATLTVGAQSPAAPGLPAAPTNPSAPRILEGGDFSGHGDRIERVLGHGCNGIGIEIDGLLYASTSSGAFYDRTINFKVEYRAVGTTGWAGAPGSPFALKNNESRPFRTSVDVALISQVPVEVAIERLTAATTNNRSRDQLVIRQVRIGVFSDIPNRNADTLLALRATATDQFFGRFDRLNGIVSQKVPVWSALARTWSANRLPSSNPAAVLRAFALGWHDTTGRLLAGSGRPAALIDDEVLGLWYEWCEAHLPQLRCDLVLERGRDAREVEALIAACGRATISWASGEIRRRLGGAEPPRGHRHPALRASREHGRVMAARRARHLGGQGPLHRSSRRVGRRGRPGGCAGCRSGRSCRFGASAGRGACCPGGDGSAAPGGAAGVFAPRHQLGGRPAGRRHQAGVGLAGFRQPRRGRRDRCVPGHPGRADDRYGGRSRLPERRQHPAPALGAGDASVGSRQGVAGPGAAADAAAGAAVGACGRCGLAPLLRRAPAGPAQDHREQAAGGESLQDHGHR